MPVLSEPLLTGHTENKEAEQTAPLSLSLLSSTSLGPGDVSLSVKALELMEQRQVRRVPELAKRMHCHSAKKKKEKNPTQTPHLFHIDPPCFSKETIVL